MEGNEYFLNKFHTFIEFFLSNVIPRLLVIKQKKCTEKYLTYYLKIYNMYNMRTIALPPAHNNYNILLIVRKALFSHIFF